VRAGLDSYTANDVRELLLLLLLLLLLCCAVLCCAVHLPHPWLNTSPSPPLPSFPGSTLMLTLSASATAPPPPATPPTPPPPLPASQVMTTVKSLANIGITVCATIHSPTTYCFSLFDKLMLLLRGRVAYYGDNGLSAVQYFQVGGRCFLPLGWGGVGY
jgi:hypothetical protein